MAKMIESRIHHDELQPLDSTKLEIDQSSTDKQTTLFQKGPFKSTLSNKRQRPGNLNIIHKSSSKIKKHSCQKNVIYVQAFDPIKIGLK